MLTLLSLCSLRLALSCERLEGLLCEDTYSTDVPLGKDIESAEKSHCHQS